MSLACKAGNESPNILAVDRAACAAMLMSTPGNGMNVSYRMSPMGEADKHLTMQLRPITSKSLYFLLWAIFWMLHSSSSFLFGKYLCYS